MNVPTVDEGDDSRVGDIVAVQVADQAGFFPRSVAPAPYLIDLCPPAESNRGLLVAEQRQPVVAVTKLLEREPTRLTVLGRGGVLLSPSLRRAQDQAKAENRGHESRRHACEFGLEPGDELLLVARLHHDFAGQLGSDVHPSTAGGCRVGGDEQRLAAEDTALEPLEQAALHARRDAHADEWAIIALGLPRRAKPPLTLPRKLFAIGPHLNTPVRKLSLGEPLTHDEIDKSAEIVICSDEEGVLPTRERAILTGLLARSRAALLLSFASPYPVADLSVRWGCLCAYSESADSVEAAVRVLAGELPARGQLLPSLAGSGIRDRRS